MSNIPAASFDVLVVAERMEIVSEGVTPLEFHIFAYLACILSLLDGRAPIWWEYEFNSTKSAAPYSSSIASALEILVANGQLDRLGRIARITPSGISQRDMLGSFSTYASRVPYLAASCRSSLAVPLATLVETIGREPQLQDAISLTQTTSLLDQAGMAQLRPHLNALREILQMNERSPEDRDLLAAAIVWLKYLAAE